ncbi:hypothetical protein J4466_05475 [Candidatus Pacearchaeota archaeon]|nr:hypothetical protein [Candidatus Pacearchaeota archaeon]
MKNHLENITREPENKNDINREDEIGRGVRRKFDIIVISSSISTGVIGIGKIFVGSVIGNDGYNGLGYGKCIESTALSALYLFVRPEYKPRDN